MRTITDFVNNRSFLIWENDSEKRIIPTVIVKEQYCCWFETDGPDEWFEHDSNKRWGNFTKRYGLREGDTIRFDPCEKRFQVGRDGFPTLVEGFRVSKVLAPPPRVSPPRPPPRSLPSKTRQQAAASSSSKHKAAASSSSQQQFVASKHKGAAPLPLHPSNHKSADVVDAGSRYSKLKEAVGGAKPKGRIAALTGKKTLAAASSKQKSILAPPARCSKLKRSIAATSHSTAPPPLPRASSSTTTQSAAASTLLHPRAHCVPVPSNNHHRRSPLSNNTPPAAASRRRAHTPRNGPPSAATFVAPITITVPFGEGTSSSSIPRRLSPLAPFVEGTSSTSSNTPRRRPSQPLARSGSGTTTSGERTTSSSSGQGSSTSSSTPPQPLLPCHLRRAASGYMGLVPTSFLRRGRLGPP